MDMSRAAVRSRAATCIAGPPSRRYGALMSSATIAAVSSLLFPRVRIEEHRLCRACLCRPAFGFLHSAKMKPVSCISWITKVESIDWPHRGQRRLHKSHHLFQHRLQFAGEPIDRHPGPFRDRPCRVFDRAIAGKKIERIELAPAVFWTVLDHEITRSCCDLKALFGEEGGGAGEVAGRADEQNRSRPQKLFRLGGILIGCPGLLLGYDRVI